MGSNPKGGFGAVIRDSYGQVLSVLFDPIIGGRLPYLIKLLECYWTLHYIEENVKK